MINRKLKLIKQIDEIKVIMGQLPSGLEQVIETLSEQQLNYYLGLAEEELFYNNV